MPYGRKRLKIGELYSVLCITTNSWHDGQWYNLPVLGKPHIDEEEVSPGNPTNGHLHQHTDVRFITPGEMQGMNWTVMTLGAVAIGKHLGFLKTDIVNQSISEIRVTYEWEVREMLRDFPLQLTSPEARKNRSDFEKRFKGCLLDTKQKICPHQGFDLANVPVGEHNGHECIVCPGHLLCFDARSGLLLRA